MLNRRLFLRGAASAAIGAASMLRAQVPEAAQGFGAPAGTSPFPPDVYRERRRRVMEQMRDGVGVLHGVTGVAPGAVSEVPVQLPDFSYLTGIQDETGAVL